MASPADLQALVNALPWTNGIELLDGAEMEALWNECIAIFESDGGEVWPTVGVPASGLGNNGDYAIDQTNKFIYGPKAAGVWPAGTSFGGAGSGALLAANNLTDVASKTASFNNLSPMTTAGDIIYGGASGAATRLPAGTSAQVLFGGPTPSWGTPTGSGATVVTSISALQALTLTSGAVVYLSAAGRTGYFVGSTANLSSAVTNDISQAITVAPSSDATGASGAWVRNYTGPVNYGWWGIVGDANFVFPATGKGTAPATIAGAYTDNGPALANYGVWGRNQTALGLSVTVETPPPTTGNGFAFNHQNCLYWETGIKEQHVINHGYYWQNMYAGSNTGYDNPWSWQALPLWSFASPRVNYSCFINQTSIGAFGFSFVNVTDALVPAGSFVTSSSTAYTIFSLGTTNWQAIGAPAGAVAGTQFIATGAGSGTGIATPVWLGVGLKLALLSWDNLFFGFPPSAQQYEYLTPWAITNFTSGAATSTVYNSSVGLLQLGFATAPFGASVGTTLNGIAVPVSGVTGTGGGVATLNATYPIYSTASSGTTITLQVPIGLTASALSGGVLGPVVIVQTQEPLEYQHRTDFPDDFIENGIFSCGIARVWGLSIGPGTIFDGNNNPHVYTQIPWDIDHVYEELFVGPPSWFTGVSVYWSFSGYKFKTINYKGVGWSASATNKVIHENATVFVAGEEDKLNDEITYNNLTWRTIAGTASALAFQSPIKSVIMDGGSVSNLTTGTVQQFTGRNVKIGNLSMFGALGFSKRHLFDNCLIGSMGGQGTAIDGGSPQTIDNATKVFWGTAGPGAGSTAGVITLVLANFTAGIGQWNMFPGSTFCLLGTNLLYTGSTLNATSGDGVVLRMYQDPTNTYAYIVTDRTDLATLPSWCPTTNNIYIFRNQSASFNRCSGCDGVRQASAAYERKDAQGNNLEYGQYKKFIIGGGSATQMQFINSVYGNLTQVTVTPRRIGSAAGAFVSIVLATYNSGSSFAADSGNMTIKTVIGIAGQRIFTQTANLVGAQSADAVTYNGGTVTGASAQLPVGRVVGGYSGSELVIQMSGVNATAPPEFIIELFFDTGICRAVVPVQLDTSGYSVFPVFNSTNLP
jgi:hypothetical protein